MTNLKNMLKITHALILLTIKIEDFDLDNVLIDEKSYENSLVYQISYKHLVVAKALHCILGLIKQMDLLQFMMELDIQHCLKVKNMLLFTTVLNILQE